MEQENTAYLTPIKFCSSSSEDRSLICTPSTDLNSSTATSTPNNSTDQNQSNCSSSSTVKFHYLSNTQIKPTYASSKKTTFSLMPLQKNSIGTMWTVELSSLKHSGTFYEAIESLRRIRYLLDSIDKSDRIRFCKTDYENCVKQLKKSKTLWSDELFKEVIAITIQYFSNCYFNKLPTVLIQEIFLWIPIENFAPVSSVCQEWSPIAVSDDIWKSFYHQKFLQNNPGSLPVNYPFYINAFHARLNDPQIGDKVEVAWRGKFRLETQDVYQGQAWWLAEIVDKHITAGRYKIRYPGWDSRWDEWVPRSRLRWAVYKNTLVSIYPNDIVELWCCGANVPGAWLESKVKKVRGDRYCIGRVLSSGYLWVERDRLRLVRRASEAPTHDSNNSSPVRGIAQGFSNLILNGGSRSSSIDGRDGSVSNNTSPVRRHSTAFVTSLSRTLAGYSWSFRASPTRSTRRRSYRDRETTCIIS